METVKVFKYKSSIITITQEQTYSREQKQLAVKLLKESNGIRELKKDKLFSIINVSRYAAEYRRELKKIIRGDSLTKLHIKFPKINKGFLANVKQHTSYDFNEKKTSSSGYKQVRDLLLTAKATIDDRNSRVQNYRSRIKYINMEEVGLYNRSVSYDIRVNMVVGRTRYEITNQYDYGRTIRYFVNRNELRNAADARRSRLIFVGKKPKTDERHISAEIEFGCTKDRNALGKLLFDAGLSEYVELKSDGSVRDLPHGYYPHEIAVCVPVSQRNVVIGRVLKVINDAGAKVNKTCGLHVHLDMRGYDHHKAFNNLVAAQTILYQMIPISRRENTYCKKTINKSYVKHLRSSNRYQGINPCSYRKYGTIEVRLHSGTTDFTKITNFMDILSAVAYNETKIVRSSSTVAGFVKQHNLSRELGEYITSRIRLFGDLVQEEVA